MTLRVSQQEKNLAKFPAPMQPCESASFDRFAMTGVFLLQSSFFVGDRYDLVCFFKIFYRISMNNYKKTVLQSCVKKWVGYIYIYLNIATKIQNFIGNSDFFAFLHRLQLPLVAQLRVTRCHRTIGAAPRNVSYTFFCEGP